VIKQNAVSLWEAAFFSFRAEERKGLIFPRSSSFKEKIMLAKR
jgi:hypothetical protein